MVLHFGIIKTDISSQTNENQTICSGSRFRTNISNWERNREPRVALAKPSIFVPNSQSNIALTLILAAVIVGAIFMFSASKSGTPGKSKSARPNILLIIGDDIGLDATTDIYPGLIDGLLKQYGPSGRNHP